jgi:TonB-dependent SusC/RagA subfamily outer membrane receptor
MLFIASQALAQNRTVSGTVTAKEDGLPLPGVSVKVSGTQVGTQTGADGKFALAVPSGSNSLQLTYIGYMTQTVKIPASNSINIVLSADAKVLGEVVVTALGISRQKKDLGYASATIGEASVTRATPVNIANGLQGKVSGLNVTSLNNGVFENVKINLRGIRSLTGNNNPLLVLDGIQTNINFLSSLNPNDIENVNVIKGSSGAAIYGPDAVNGVIIVTTKKSTKGENKPEINYSHATQAQQISFFPKFQETFGSGGGGEYIPYETGLGGLLLMVNQY